MARPASTGSASMSAPEITSAYQVERSGLLAPEHRFSDSAGSVGVLTLQRGRGLVVGGRWSPVRGEVLVMRRDPGLLRSQFSLWTEAREWLGSALRPNLMRREIMLHTGSRPLRLLPLTGFRAGWVLQAPKTGDMARMALSLLRGRDRIEVYRKLDFELLVFGYFLGIQLRLESFWPGPVEASGRSAARLAG